MLTYPAEIGLNLGFSLHLHSYFVYASSEGSGEWAYAQTHRALTVG